MSLNTSIPLWQRLSSKLAWWVVVIAVGLGILFSALQIYLDYFNVHREFDTTNRQVLNTLKKPATQAVYQLDPVLGYEVIQGLFNYAPIFKVTLFDERNEILAEDERKLKKSRLRYLSELLFGPHLRYRIPLYLEEEGKHFYGTLEVFVDTRLPVAGFVERAKVAILSATGWNLLLATIIFFLFQMLVNRPLAGMAGTLLQIDPVNPEKTRLSLPSRHEKDELGCLATTINKLLHSIDEKVAERERINEELEERVIMRTHELQAANLEIIALNKRLAAENLRMGAELEITRRLQEMVLPKQEELSRINALDIACFMQPASEVGGDYYDVLQYREHIKIGVGDVTGHGLESGVVMLMVQTAVRALQAAGITEPVTFFTALNQTLYSNVQRMNTDKSMTLALLDYQAGGVLKLCGQHEEVLLVRTGGDIERVDTVDLGFMIGLEEDISEFINHRELRLSPGDGVVLYTDGITEAFNTHKEMYGLDRLCEVISRHWSASADRIRQAVIADVERHMGDNQPMDDITLLVIKQN